MPKKSKMIRFAIGDMPEANLEVLAETVFGKCKETQKYLCHMYCCDAELILNHRVIEERIKDKAVYCGKCAPYAKKKKQEISFWRGPEWPVPNRR